MTAEEVVMSAYAAFGAGDMDALAKLNIKFQRIQIERYLFSKRKQSTKR